MKQSDIIAIILVGMIGIAVSWIGVNALLGNPDDAQVSFKTIKVIDAKLDTPDPEVFNVDAINPTVEVYTWACENGENCGQEQEEEPEEESEVTPTPTPSATIKPLPVSPSLAPTSEPTVEDETPEETPEESEEPETQEE